MPHGRRKCMITEPNQATVPAGEVAQFKLDPDYRGEQWFTVAMTVESAPGSGNVTFGDCVNLKGNPALTYPVPNYGYLTVDDADIPVKITGAVPNDTYQKRLTFTFFGEPVQGTLGITNTTDRAVTVQIFHADRFFQEI